MRVVVPVGDSQRRMVRAVSRHAGAVALFHLRNERVPQTMRTGGEAELLLLEGKRAVNGSPVHRLAVSGEKQRAGMIGCVGAGF